MASSYSISSLPKISLFALFPAVALFRDHDAVMVNTLRSYMTQ